MKQKFQNIAIAKCLIWCAILLSPLQALQGMHVLCVHCAVCSCDSEADHSPHNHGDCCCSKSGLEFAEPNASTGVLPFTPCPCEPDCWCHRPMQPQIPSQESSNTFSSCHDTSSVSVVDSPVVQRACLTHLFLCDFWSLSAQETCVSLCRFQA